MNKWLSIDLLQLQMSMINLYDLYKL